MAINIKDGTSAAITVKSSTDGSDQVPHHNVDVMPATAASSGLPALPAKTVLVSGSNPSSQNVPLQLNASGYLLTSGSGATAAEGAALPAEFTVVAGDDGTDTHPLQQDASGSLKVVLQAGTAAYGKLAANAGVNVGSVDIVSVGLNATVYHGKTTVTTAGTEVTLASSQALTAGVTIKALSSNTGLIYVGLNPVTSATGFELNAKESVFIEVANLTTLYIDSAVNGEGVTYLGS